MANSIPKSGQLTLEDGELVARKADGEPCGRFYVGPDGVVFEGELTLFQANDPPKLRFASSYDDWRGLMGAFSFNVVRPSGRQDEIVFVGGGLAEDVVAGELRGQIQWNVRGHGQDGPDTKVLIATEAATDQYGYHDHKMRILGAEFVSGLRNF